MAITRPIPPPPIPTPAALRRPDDTDPTTTRTPTSTPIGASTVIVRPWIDPLVDDTGHDPRSAYVERFWLGVLGPPTIQ